MIQSFNARDIFKKKAQFHIINFMILIIQQYESIHRQHCSDVICFPHQFIRQWPWVLACKCIHKNHVTWACTHTPWQIPAGNINISICPRRYNVQLCRERVFAMVSNNTDAVNSVNLEACRWFGMFRFINQNTNTLNYPKFENVCVQSPGGVGAGCAWKWFQVTLRLLQK